jgi:hypothetical protein
VTGSIALLTKILPSSKRINTSLQTGLIRIYKGIGLLALIGILVGLISFLTVNVYYLFDNTWIRPMILSPSHEKVMAAHAALAEESYRRDQLEAKRDELMLELEVLDKSIAMHSDFQADYLATVEAQGATGYEALMARYQRSRSVVEQAEAVRRKSVIRQQMENLDKGIARQDAMIAQIKKTPYFATTDRQVTVAFVPYENLHTIHKGAPVYGCKWGLVRCSQVGAIVSRLEGEIIDSHPHSSTALRGVMVALKLKHGWAAEERALFVGSRPLWIF